VTLQDCRFDERVSFFGSRLRRLSLQGSTLAGLSVSGATLDTTLQLSGCTSVGEIGMVATRIGGALIMNGAQLSGDSTALDGISLHVFGDVLARDGFTCRGALRLSGAQIGGALACEGARLDNADGIAMWGLDLHVGSTAHLCDGFSANGTVLLSYARITSTLCFGQAIFTGAAPTSLDCRHLVCRELVLLPADPPTGSVVLSHARLGVLRDDPATWPSAMNLDGLTYESLAEPARRDRLRWLRLDPDGFRPQAYTQLADNYRGAGRDDDARTVLLSGERHRREFLGRPGRWWGYLQDLTVGYGYRPVRAAAWLTFLLVLGSVVFGLYPPRAIDAARAPQFVGPIYALDLIVPVIDFGQQSEFQPRGASAWLAYTLIVAGLILVTTIGAAGARRLRRS
jgi:hypothetical protein